MPYHSLQFRSAPCALFDEPVVVKFLIEREHLADTAVHIHDRLLRLVKIKPLAFLLISLPHSTSGECIDVMPCKFGGTLIARKDPQICLQIIFECFKLLLCPLPSESLYHNPPPFITMLFARYLPGLLVTPHLSNYHTLNCHSRCGVHHRSKRRVFRDELNLSGLALSEALHCRFLLIDQSYNNLSAVG